MAQQPQSKRARVEDEIPSFDKVDLSRFALKDYGKSKNGHKTFPLVAGECIQFNLTPGGWLKSPFGFDVNTKFEKPSFLGGKEPETVGTPEGLNLRINIDNCRGRFPDAAGRTVQGCVRGAGQEGGMEPSRGRSAHV